MKPVDANDGRLVSVVIATRCRVGGVTDRGQRHMRVKTAVVAFDLQVNLAFKLHQTRRFHPQSASHSTQFQQAQDNVTGFTVQH